VESEIVVEADHSEAHRHPATIREIRRILLLHLQETQQQRFPVVPIGHQTSATVSEPSTRQTAEREPAATLPTPPLPLPMVETTPPLPLDQRSENTFRVESRTLPSD
jgi:hypothetical protein